MNEKRQLSVSSWALLVASALWFSFLGLKVLQLVFVESTRLPFTLAQTLSAGLVVVVIAAALDFTAAVLWARDSRRDIFFSLVPNRKRHPWAGVILGLLILAIGGGVWSMVSGLSAVVWGAVFICLAFSGRKWRFL